MAFTFDLLLEKMGGERNSEVCHENFTGESSSKVKLMTPDEVTKMFPNVQLSTSDYIAYLPATMCRSLPVVNKRGRCFTPRVIAKSAASAYDGLVDFEHILKDNDFSRDVVVGHIKAVRFGEQVVGNGIGKDAASVNALPLIPKAPMPLSVLLALYMRTNEVPRILEEHLSGECEWKTSMECSYLWKDCAFYYENEFIPLPDAPPGMLECIEKAAVRPYKGKPLSLALGGEDNAIDYWAIGMTSHPADEGSDILALVSGRDTANTGTKYLPVKAAVKTGKWKNSQEASEIASMFADEKLKEVAAIEVLGKTQPAEDGHTHDILTDGTISPANGHTHYLSSYQLVRGTNPRFTGRTGEHTVYPLTPDGSRIYDAGSTHFHLIDIPLRGGKKSKDSAETGTDTASQLTTLLSELEDNMASKFSEILARAEKVLSRVKSGEEKEQGTELASMVDELRKLRIEDEIKSEVQKEIASMIESGELVKKEDHEKAITEAVEAKVEELTEEQKKQKEEAERVAARLEQVAGLGVDLDHSLEDGGETIRAMFSNIPFDATGDRLFQAELRSLKLAVDAEKAKAAPAAEVTTGTGSSAANTGKVTPKKKTSLLIGNAGTDTANDGKGGTGGMSNLLSKYGGK